MIRSALLTAIFPGGEAHLQAHSQLARLCVLMEDLRIEVHCLYDDSVSAATQTDPNVSKLYFLRRAVATLVEFAECVRLLDAPSSADWKLGGDAAALIQWQDAATFFRSKEEFFKRIRNDVGGHFGSEAARYAVSNLEPRAITKMELLEARPGEWVERLHFVSLIAATAFMRHLQGNNTTEKIANVMELVSEAVRHATLAVHVIAAIFLWPRFCAEAGPSEQ